MSATDVLRRMLDECGVEWREHEAPATDCIAFFDGNGWHDCWESVGGEVNVTFSLTPEQAIAATLGSCNCSNSERTNEPCLPHFWTHDGTLHIEATRMPTRIVVCEGGTCEFVPKRELDTSEAENAKLRELVRDAWGDGHPDRSCEGCDIRDECYDDVERIRKDGVLRFSRCLFELRIEDRMRELGIEVDDGNH